MSKKIYCIAEFTPVVGHEQELFERLMSLEPLALREDGCLRYLVTRQVRHPHVPLQAKFPIMFNEEWASLEDFEAHSAKPYLTEFFNKYVQDPATSITADWSVRIFSDEI